MKYNLKLFLNNFHGCSSGKIGENQIQTHLKEIQDFHFQQDGVTGIEFNNPSNSHNINNKRTDKMHETKV